MAIEVCSGEGVDQSVLVSPPLVTFPSVILDDMRYPAANLGVHSWVAHCLFALVARELDRRQQTESFRVVQCLRVSWRQPWFKKQTIVRTFSDHETTLELSTQPITTKLPRFSACRSQDYNFGVS